MHRVKALSAIALALLLTTVGCASSSSKQGVGGYLDDALITTKVKAAFLDDDLLTSYKINVETLNGVVTLSGTVRDRSEISQAVEDASRVTGVKSVTNALQQAK
jgi:osmotically-inducible protein OsmY